MNHHLLISSLVVAATGIAAGSFAACGHDSMNDGDVSALSVEVQDARTEVARHHDTTMAASTLSDLPAELSRHEERMQSIMDRMDDSMGGMMSHCSGSGMTRMHDELGSMHDEMQSYRQDMAAVTTLDDARTRCTNHTEAMNGMLDGMHSALGDSGCPMH